MSIIIPLYVERNNVEAATSEQTTPTLTLNITNATASLDLIVSDNDGTFATSPSDNKATFTVTTNNFTGYTLSIKSSSSSTDLSGSAGSFSSISSSMDSAAFDKSDYNGKWGYLPSKYNSSANTTTYYPSPKITGSTLDATSSANSTANSYTIAIGARADYSKPVGTYSNTYILTTVINGFNYSVSYGKGNTTDTVTGLPSVQSASATSVSSITVSSTKPTRSGYDFTGWCSTMPTTSNGTDSCSGDTYASGATYYFNKTSDNSSITLYAMWEEEKVYMQDLTFTECPSTVTKVYDKRDGNDYQIVKINGVCWMVQNLRYVGDGIGSSTSLSTSTSNVSSNKSITFYDLANSTNCGANSAGYSNPCIKDSGNTTAGAWYNFAAASAGYVTGDSNDGSSNYDICPSGWHLPTGPFNNSGEDGYSVFQSTSNGFIPASNASAPLRNYFMVTSGLYSNGSLLYESAHGRWWSATVYSAAARYYLYYNTSYGFYNNYGDRSDGIPVRCVMTPPTINDITYLQEVTQDMVSQMSVGDTATLKDKRDNQSYMVGKLADNNLWLLDNLRLDPVNVPLADLQGQTNATDAELTYFKNGGGSTSDRYATSGVSTWPSSSSYSAPYVNASYKDNTTTSYGKGSGKIGVYYNYCAVSAGTYCYGDGDSSAGSPSGDATADVCPSGWRMPTDGASGEYQTLYAAYNKNFSNFRDALSLILSGSFGGGSAAGQGTFGNFWTSTYGSSEQMYYMGIRSYLYSPSTWWRSNGFTVRCILK